MAHARATLASQTNGSMNYPFTMLFHVELAESDQEYEIIDT
jgi:hypothetical protein